MMDGHEKEQRFDLMKVLFWNFPQGAEDPQTG
jgi:hypothetical protein